MKKKILAAIFIICVLFFVGSTIYEKVAYSKLSFDEKILEIMNFDEISGTKNVDNIVSLIEVDGGYFCIGTASVEETVHFGFIKEENNKLEFGGKSFSSIPVIVYNDDPTSFLRTSILNFSEKDFYYGCYQHKDDLNVLVNDNQVEIHNFSLNYQGKEFDMDFWLVCSENEPTVTVK